MTHVTAILFLVGWLSGFSRLAGETTVPIELSSIEWQEINRRSSYKLHLNVDGTFNLAKTFRSAEVSKDDSGRDAMIFRDRTKKTYSGTWRMLSSEHTLLALYYEERWLPLGVRLYRRPVGDAVWQLSTVALRHRKFDRYDRPSAWIEVATGWHAYLRDLAHYPDERKVLSLLGVRQSQTGAPSRVPSKIAAKVTTLIPEGWSTQTIGNALLVSRDKPVVVENLYGRPRSHEEGSVNRKVEDWNASTEVRYVLILRFGEKVSQVAYQQMLQRQASTEEDMEKISDQLKLYSYKTISSYRPNTDDDWRLFHEYKRLQSSIEELPAFSTEHHSIWFSESTNGYLNFVSDEVAKECQSVKETLQPMFRSY